MKRAAVAFWACTLVFATLGARVEAKTINVHPGKDALQDAVQRAKSGDTLRVHEGRYREDVRIGKKLRLERVDGEARPLVDGDCKTNDTIYISAQGVTLKGLKVIGADDGEGAFPSEVFFDGPDSGRAKDVVVRDTCDAEYGINMFATGHLKILGNRAGGGFSDSGIYVGGIQDTAGGRLLVKDNEAFGNNRGIIVEDVNPAADVRIAQNDVHDNTLSGEGMDQDGIFLNNSDGAWFVNNSSRDNGAAGYHANSLSEGNVFIGNTASGNDGGAYNDEGASNCGAGNSFPVDPC